jgi:hypothetical protein
MKHTAIVFYQEIKTLSHVQRILCPIPSITQHIKQQKLGLLLVPTSRLRLSLISCGQGHQNHWWHISIIRIWAHADRLRIKPLSCCFRFPVFKIPIRFFNLDGATQWDQVRIKHFRVPLYGTCILRLRKWAQLLQKVGCLWHFKVLYYISSWWNAPKLVHLANNMPWRDHLLRSENNIIFNKPLHHI